MRAIFHPPHAKIPPRYQAVRGKNLQWVTLEALGKVLISLGLSNCLFRLWWALFCAFIKHQRGSYRATIWSSITLLQPNCPLRQVPIFFKRQEKRARADERRVDMRQTPPHRWISLWSGPEMRGLPGFVLAVLALLVRPLFYSIKAGCWKGPTLIPLADQ